MKLCLHRVGRKEGVSVIQENSARPQGARRKMAGLPARNCMCQDYTLILPNFVKGKCEIPENFPEGCILAHKVVGQIT